MDTSFAVLIRWHRQKKEPFVWLFQEISSEDWVQIGVRMSMTELDRFGLANLVERSCLSRFGIDHFIVVNSNKVKVYMIENLTLSCPQDYGPLQVSIKPPSCYARAGLFFSRLWGIAQGGGACVQSNPQKKSQAGMV